MSPRYMFRKLTGVCLFLSVFLVQALVAQSSATIKGRVVDATTGDALPGANVFLENTSIGTATDLDGNYILRLVPLGPWKLKSSYVGYKPVTIDLVLTDGSTIERTFRLAPQVIEGEMVIVSAQAQGQMQAINQQLASNKIASVVSEARIQELPDFNAAQAISRLPGVSTTESSGEANKVVIRGLAPQYNLVSVGGISMASTGSTQIGAVSQPGLGLAGTISTDRSVDLTMVTPYMIKSIEVFKSLTPDMNANAIGGVVNMQLREAPEGFRTDALWQSGYTQKSGKYGNFRVIGSASGRFLDDRFGAYVLASAERYDRDADNMTAGYTTGLLLKDTVTGYNKVQVTNIQLNRHLETRKRFGGNLVLDYKLRVGLIRSINMFSRLVSDFSDDNVILDFQNNLLNFRHRSGEGTTDVGVHTLETEYDFGFMSLEAKAAYTYSRNSLPESPLFQFRQTGGVATGAVPYDTHPEKLIPQVTYRGPTQAYLTSLNLFSTEYRETGKLVKGDFKFPLNITTGITGYVKAGGEYRQNHHLNDQSTPYADLSQRMRDSLEAHFPVVYDRPAARFPANQFTNTNSKMFDPFLDNKFGSMYWVADRSMLTAMTKFVQSRPDFNAVFSTATTPEGWFDGYFQSLPNDYDYTENYSAVYAMTHMNLGADLMVVGGIRLETVTSDFLAYNLRDGRNPATQVVDTVTAKPSNRFWLPMAQFKWNIFEWSNLRYSYSQTLARPAYNQLSPHFNISYDGANVWSGNPNLKTAQSYNHDVILTFHGNWLGLLSIGGFYKEIKNFTYYTQYRLRANTTVPGFLRPADLEILGRFPNEGALLNTYANNSYIAYVRGLEIDFQTRFWYLPFPLDGLLLGANYTRISSKATYPLRDERTFGIPGRPGFRVEQIDSTRDGRLIFQPNDVANAFIGYEYKGFSARVSFVFQGNSVSGIGRFPEQDGFTDDYYRVDFAVRQLLPWPGLQLFLDVNNLNNRMNISRQISIPGFTRQQHYGLVANLGVRYRL